MSLRQILEDTINRLRNYRNDYMAVITPAFSRPNPIFAAIYQVGDKYQGAVLFDNGLVFEYMRVDRNIDIVGRHVITVQRQPFFSTYGLERTIGRRAAQVINQLTRGVYIEGGGYTKYIRLVEPILYITVRGDWNNFTVIFITTPTSEIVVSVDGTGKVVDAQYSSRSTTEYVTIPGSYPPSEDNAPHSGDSSGGETQYA